MTSICLATADDIHRIGEVAEAGGLFAAAMTRDMIAPFLSGNEEDIWLVAKDDTTVRGFLYAATEKFTEGTHNLLAMAAAPECKGQGLGTALVAGVEQRLSDRGARIILVETSSQAQFDPTTAFYRARGYEQEARIRDYWADGDDKLIFRKRIRKDEGGKASNSDSLA